MHDVTPRHGSACHGIDVDPDPVAHRHASGNHFHILPVEEISRKLTRSAVTSSQVDASRGK